MEREIFVILNISIQVLTDDMDFKTQFTTPRARGPIDIKLTIHIRT